MITIGLSQILRADGRPKTATVSTIIGCILNCILDPLFIFGFEWGMAGAAWATIIGQIATSLSTGMGQGAQPVIGYCYGHGSYDRVKKTIYFVLYFAAYVVFIAVLWYGFISFITSM
jgi:Na+-driven multidrug efflux pump